MSTHPIRTATDADGPALARLIAACFSEYPGCLYVPEEFPELGAPASAFSAKGGLLWVVADGDGLVGSLGVAPVPGQGAAEITKVYVAPALRGGGLAQALFARAAGFAEERGIGELMLWSDTRFTRGHRFYEKLGFRRWPGERFLSDVSDSWEYHYRLTEAGQP